MQSFTVLILTPCQSNPGFLEGTTVTISANSAAEASAIARQQHPGSIIEVEE